VLGASNTKGRCPRYTRAFDQIDSNHAGQVRYVLSSSKGFISTGVKTISFNRKGSKRINFRYQIKMLTADSLLALRSKQKRIHDVLTLKILSPVTKTVQYKYSALCTN